MKILLNEMTSMGEGRCKICRDDIYAGCVVKLYLFKQDNKSSETCRKIMFTLNEDETVNDLLYDSPNYKVNVPSTSSKDFYVTDIVKLGDLLKHEGYRKYIDEDQVLEIFNAYLTRKYGFYREDHKDLPLTLREYATLEVLSKLSGKPSKKEKKEFEKFKPKAKTYTFR